VAAAPIVHNLFMTVYDWNTLPAEQLNPFIKRQAVHLSNMTLARLELAKDAVVVEHHHVHEQVSTVERGLLRFRIGGREVDLGAGQSLAIPSGVPHGVVALEDTVVTDVFSPPRDDWQSGNDAYLRK
jgi:quercetin dioxygenase-like cupin family protein